MNAMWHLLVSLATLTSQAIALVPPACQQQLDSFCNSDKTCVSALSSRGDKLPLVARNDTDEQHGPPEWRCYSPSSLSPDLSHYTSGTAYCSRESQLVNILAECTSNTTFVNVFTPGEGGYPCIRIPAILLAGDNKTLLAYAECRNWTGDGCEPSKFNIAPTDNSNKDLCQKISVDGGKTWGPLQVIIKNAGQPSPVWDAATNTLIMTYLQLSPPGNFQRTSKDMGQTWSEPQSLASVLGADNGIEVGPGVGIQLSRRNKYAGRLLFIGHHGAYEHDDVWYSDDNGQNYHLSKTNFAHMDEAQLVELPNGNVMANMRNSHYNQTCKCRGVAVSTDGGATFGPVYYDPALISPVCMASILRGYNNQIFFANPATTSSRTHGVIRRSDDGAKTWAKSLLVWSGDYGYSCLTLVPGTTTRIGLLWETSMDGCSGASCRSVFSTFSSDLST
eukprot:m.91606 g.91606  ORF g.91606 m.91606 type:complete len:447 (-) comp21663_c0_seq5:367-1707(-)